MVWFAVRWGACCFLFWDEDRMFLRFGVQYVLVFFWFVVGELVDEMVGEWGG